MIKLFLFFLILALWICSSDAKRSNITGTVIKVIDGDTFDLRTTDGNVLRIRLHGIDAPEFRQPYGRQSSRFLSDLIDNREVTVLSSKRDHYNRIIGTVLLNLNNNRNVNINETMVLEGQAWWSKLYAPNNSVLRKAQNYARKNRIGLWNYAEPIAPWTWRKQYN